MPESTFIPKIEAACRKKEALLIQARPSTLFVPSLLELS